MKKYWIIIIALTISSIAFCQKDVSPELKIVYYNCDNLFDLTNDNWEIDNEFTASGKYHWGEERYKAKIEGIRDEILTISEESFPDILVLGGVENKEIVNELISGRKFKKSDYSVHFKNGSSIAILVRGAVTSLSFEDMIFDNREDPGKGTLLYAITKINALYDYHLFINMWPSRSEGNEYDRIKCAVTVRKEIDNILNFEQNARIIVMGTFNDEPTNKSMLSILNASNKRKNIDYRDFYNPFYDSHNLSGNGTMVLNGILQMYDYMVLSPHLLRTNEGYGAGFNSASVLKNGKSEPMPTFRGSEYMGGASGHFPVMIKLKLQK